MYKKLLGIFLGAALLLSACSPAAIKNGATQSPTLQETNPAAPAWFGYVFTDAASGTKFSMDDFKGKVVLVETLAMWCTNCHAQQQQVLALHSLLGAHANFISVGIDIDTNEKLNDLKSYVASNGFNWTYSIASPGVAREIGQLYGSEFLNPPSTPMLIIDAQGVAHPLPFGIKSAENLQKALAPYLGTGM